MFFIKNNKKINKRFNEQEKYENKKNKILKIIEQTGYRYTTIEERKQIQDFINKS